MVRRSVTFPESLLKQLEDCAAMNRRSTNQEIVARLEASIDRVVNADLAELTRLRTGG